MERFEKINKVKLSRLMVDDRRLSPYDLIQDNLKVLGVRQMSSRSDDYEIVDYSYYHVLKSEGFTPNLANMIALHNYLLERG